MERDDLEVLERMVDGYGLAGVLEALAQIASEKADHIRASYADNMLARRWEADAKAITKTSIYCDHAA